MKNNLFVVLVFLCAVCSRLGAADRPNIILLYADDAGYHDFGFQGNDQFQTPHLDRLAASGVVFTQFYMTASVCGPSRAGMLTGQYQQRFGFEENNVPGIMSASGTQGEEMGLPLHLSTMGDHLQKLGYRTALFGKWHLGIADRYHPTKRGFDEFVGFRGGARSFFPYAPGKAPTRGHLLERGFGQFEEHDGYLTNVLADEACAFIERNRAQPFFAFVSFNAVHTPMHIDPADADAFPELEGKRRKVAQMALSLDRACGQIMDTLDTLGLRENTLVVFTNDNGGPTMANRSNNYPLSGVKATHLEGGIRVPSIVSWPDKFPAGSRFEPPASALDLLPTFLTAGGGDVSNHGDLDGVDLAPFLSGKNPDRPHQTLYWKMELRGTIRDGDWKLLRSPDRPAELFNLADDPAEQHDLAQTHPERLREMFSKLHDWELELERPLFQLRRQEGALWQRLYDGYRNPSSASPAD